MADRILRRKEVIEILGVSKSTVRRWELAGLLPQRIVLGPARIGWLEREIMAFIASRPRADEAHGGDSEAA